MDCHRSNSSPCPPSDVIMARSCISLSRSNSSSSRKKVNQFETVAESENETKPKNSKDFSNVSQQHHTEQVSHLL